MSPIHLPVSPLRTFPRWSHSSLSFLYDARYICMTMLLIPLSVSATICLNPRTPVLGVTKTLLDCVIQMRADVVRGLASSPSHSQGTTWRVILWAMCWNITVWPSVGFAVWRGMQSTSLVIAAISTDRRLHIPNAYLGRFLIHPDLVEPFIAFSWGQGMTDEQEVSVRKAFADKKFLLPPQPWVMMGWVAPSAHSALCVFQMTTRLVYFFICIFFICLVVNFLKKQYSSKLNKNNT